MKRTLWETYFNTAATRKMGRRVKKNFPSEKLIDILKSMNLDFQVYEARYPKSPSRAEKKIEVEWEGSKENLIKKIEELAISVS